MNCIHCGNLIKEVGEGCYYHLSTNTSRNVRYCINTFRNVFSFAERENVYPHLVGKIATPNNKLILIEDE